MVFLSTPNGIRTRAATLKGWKVSFSEPSETTDQRLVQKTLAVDEFASAILWAVTLSSASSTRSPTDKGFDEPSGATEGSRLTGDHPVGIFGTDRQNESMLCHHGRPVLIPIVVLAAAGPVIGDQLVDRGVVGISGDG